MVSPHRSLYVIQHTDSEHLGHLEDHLEGRNIRFTYMRPHATGGTLPATVSYTDGVILLGGGPWGSAGGRDVPTLDQEIALVRDCMLRGTPVVGLGLGAQILTLASGGRVESCPTRFEIIDARRTTAQALNGFMPETFPVVVYMRDWPVPAPHAEVLATDPGGRALVFQPAPNCLAFAGHPGTKAGIAEDLIMEFEEGADDPRQALDDLRRRQPEIEDALVSIMTGLVQVAGWMDRA